VGARARFFFLLSGKSRLVRRDYWGGCVDTRNCRFVRSFWGVGCGLCLGLGVLMVGDDACMQWVREVCGHVRALLRAGVLVVLVHRDW
jgi:hypothetical protein